MTSKSEISTLIFQTIGSPIGTGKAVPDPEKLEDITQFAFKSRVGLLFLEECLKKGVPLGPKAQELYDSLTERRLATDKVVVKLAKKLDEVAKGEWVLFKSIKPFASTPNDTDWFPLDSSRHGELCDHLQADGSFKLLETAPRQTTLVEQEGVGLTDTTKKGGVYYIDCYVAPSTDYFVYLDPARMRGHVTHTTINGYTIPILKPHAELTAIMFHNLFPEKVFTIESYYLIKCYLDAMERDGLIDEFVDVCREQKVEYACACNLAVVRQIDAKQFNLVDSRIDYLLARLGHKDMTIPDFDPLGAFPYTFTNGAFWRTFLSKQRDPTSFRSSLVQFAHMLNPVFFVDVVQILWRRCVRGGVYEQN